MFFASLLGGQRFYRLLERNTIELGGVAVKERPHCQPAGRNPERTRERDSGIDRIKGARAKSSPFSLIKFSTENSREIFLRLRKRRITGSRDEQRKIMSDVMKRTGVQFLTCKRQNLRILLRQKKTAL